MPLSFLLSLSSFFSFLRWRELRTRKTRWCRKLWKREREWGRRRSLPPSNAHMQAHGKRVTEWEKIFSPSHANAFGRKETREQRTEIFFHPRSLDVAEELSIIYTHTYMERVWESLRADGSFSCVVKHKDDGQTKFIKPNSQRQDRKIKYWVSIGSIHREQGWL